MIIGREFNQRVRKRTFILTTVLTPLLMVVLMVAPVLLNKVGGSRQLEILVLDRSGWIAPQLQSGALLKLTPTDLSEDELGAPGNRYNYLVIGEDVLSDPGDVRLYTKEALTFDVENDLKSQLGRIIEKRKLEAHDIRNLSQIMQEVKTDVSMQTFQRHDTGERRASSGVLSMTASYLFGFLIYMFVFMYGVMVMHGVIEEKNSRVLEIIVSSVRPFELMLGKILGIASVALVQFLIWVALILALGTAALHLLTPDALIRSAAVPGVVPQMDAGTLAAIRAGNRRRFPAEIVRRFPGLFRRRLPALCGDFRGGRQRRRQRAGRPAVADAGHDSAGFRDRRDVHHDAEPERDAVRLVQHHPVHLADRDDGAHSVRSACVAVGAVGRVALRQFPFDGVGGRQNLPGGDFHVRQEARIRRVVQMDKI